MKLRKLKDCFDGELREYQKDAVKFALTNHFVFLGDKMGLGKAEPLDAKILTPTSWVNMGDLKIGDEVIGKNGKPTKIIGIFPQGTKEVFKVTFQDGAQAECCEDHLWNIQSPSMRNKTPQEWVTLPLKDFKSDLFSKSGNSKHFIPIVDKVEFKAKSNFISPYIMGVLLGDGCLRQGTPSFTKTLEDIDIINRVRSELPCGVELNSKEARTTMKHSLVKTEGNKNPITQELERLNLRVNSESKYIPDEYLFNSIENRVAILQGLLDTDGYVSKGGTVQFASSSQKLAEGVTFLVRSLGGITKTKNKKVPNYKDSHIVTITLPNDINPFYLSRKSSRVTKNTKYFPRRSFKSVESIGFKPCQCIKVDAEDSLYVTNDFIVTHNTPTAIALSLVTDLKTLIVVPSYLKPNWLDKWRTFAKNKDEILIINKKKDFELIDSCRVVVCSYGMINKLGVRQYSKFKVLIADEAHYLKTHSTIRTKALTNIVENTYLEYCLLMSGTPIEKSVTDWYSHFRILSHCPLDVDRKPLNGLDMRYFFKSFEAFAHHFCFIRNIEVKSKNPRFKNMKKKKYYGFKNKEMFYKLQAKKYLARESDVLNLPPLEEIDVMLETKYKGWKELEKAYKSDDDLSFSAEKLISAKEKTMVTFEFVKNLMDEGEGPVVIFSDHVHPVVTLYEKLGKYFKVGKITGATNVDERFSIVKSFQDGKLDIIVMTIGAGSTGFDLFRANKMVFNDESPNPTSNDQAIGRIYRSGQTRNCLIYKIYGSEIDRRLTKLILEKNKVIKETT